MFFFSTLFASPWLAYAQMFSLSLHNNNTYKCCCLLLLASQTQRPSTICSFSRHIPMTMPVIHRLSKPQTNTISSTVSEQIIVFLKFSSLKFFERSSNKRDHLCNSYEYNSFDNSRQSKKHINTFNLSKDATVFSFYRILYKRCWFLSAFERIACIQIYHVDNVAAMQCRIHLHLSRHNEGAVHCLWHRRTAIVCRHL